MGNHKRPKLSKSINLKHFVNFYWLKSELIQFCREQRIHALGSKIELTERIKIFFEIGVQSNQPPLKINRTRDALAPIESKQSQFELNLIMEWYRLSGPVTKDK
jgi:hypothetical protein